MRVPLVSLALVALIGCAPAAETPPSPADTMAAAPSPLPGAIAGREWRLVAVGEQTEPLGAGGQSPTLTFDSASARAHGFAGCNTWSAGYALKGDSLRFETPIATLKMCADGMEVETTYLAMLPAVRTFAADESTLVLSADGAPLARFRSP
jgi:heat shock protein HslJ